MKKNIVAAPPIRPIREIKLPDHEYRQYPNGLECIIVDAGVQPVFRLETLFRAGRYYEEKPLVSAATLKMIREGAEGYDAEQIAETIDFYGARLAAPSNLDESGLLLEALDEHFDALFPVYRAMLLRPAFPEQDLREYVQERKQQLRMDLSRNDIASYRKVTEDIFGPQHPYGYNSSEEAYDQLRTEDLRAHYEKNYLAGNALVVVSGRIGTAMMDRLENELFPYFPSGTSAPKQVEAQAAEQKRQHIHRPGSFQTAIRLGRRLFKRPHPDYPTLSFLNVILGDYFSSRLMMNLREDKGYTYGVGSSLDIFRQDGMFMVSTETSNEHAEDALRQIFIEFERLREELIPLDELAVARNYTLGNLLSSLDGPSNVARVLKRMKLNGMEPEKALNDIVERVQHASPEALREMARKYLQAEDMHLVMVGDMGKES